MKLGSLFDGSGGFPLAGVLHGIEPVWASEIEPFPIRVTKNRFPNMKHLGSVTEVNGAEVEPVDIITFGSPCQDLSVAGKQLGIHEGQRSSLFFEAIRIIKEMREHDRATGRADFDIRPRFAVWENVPGAFSSNKGADFIAVLQAFCEIKDPGAVVPVPEKGRLEYAGSIVGNGYSNAWRVYDAQFWGVPQRRKRIYLIADFGSERAGEILFKPESVCRNPSEGRETWQRAAYDAEGSAGRSDFVKLIAAFMGGQGAKARSIAYCDDGSTPTLKASPSGGNTVPDVVYPINTMVATRGGKDDGRTTFGIGEPGDPQFTLQAAHEHAVCYATEEDGALAVYDARGHGGGQIVPTITGDHNNRITDYTALALARSQSFDSFSIDETAGTIKARDYKQSTTDIVIERKPQRKYIVRRLTPTECARLQGFPDWWCDGANGSDSAQYKLWGNGIALPCAADVIGRIAEGMEKEG